MKLSGKSIFGENIKKYIPRKRINYVPRKHQKVYSEKTSENWRYVADSTEFQYCIPEKVKLDDSTFY